MACRFSSNYHLWRAGHVNATRGISDELHEVDIRHHALAAVRVKQGTNLEERTCCGTGTQLTQYRVENVNIWTSNYAVCYHNQV